MNEDTREDRRASTGWYRRLRGILSGDPASKQDLLALLSDERWQDVLDSDELQMIRGVLEVSETQVRDVMIPRSQMVVLERSAGNKAILNTIIQSGHSRFPVIGDDKDEVVGILLAKDVLVHFVDTPNEDLDLDRFLRSATVIPESKRLNTLLKEFRVSRNHMAIVVDEYGGTSGLLTIEDVIEEIVGEIDDEHDPEEVQDIQRHDTGRFHVRALTRIEVFNEYFEVSLSDDDYDTVGGLVIHELGRLPRRGESIEFGGFRFKVLQADRRRVHNLEVVPEDPASADDAVAAN